MSDSTELIKLADEVEDIERLIPKKAISKSSLGEFKMIDGDYIKLDNDGESSTSKMLFSRKEKALYKKLGAYWFKHQIKQEPDETEEIKEYLREVNKWLRSHKDYVDGKFIEFEKMMTESLEELKKYIDLRFKEK